MDRGRLKNGQRDSQRGAVTFIYFRPALCFIFVYNCGLTARNKRVRYVMLRCYHLVLVGRVERNLADLLVLLSVAHYVANRHLDTLQQRRLRRVAVALSADRQAATVI